MCVYVCPPLKVITRVAHNTSETNTRIVSCDLRMHATQGPPGRTLLLHTEEVQHGPDIVSTSATCLLPDVLSDTSQASSNTRVAHFRFGERWIICFCRIHLSRYRPTPSEIFFASFQYLPEVSTLNVARRCPEGPPCSRCSLQSAVAVASCILACNWLR